MKICSRLFFILILAGLVTRLSGQDPAAKPAFRFFNKTESGIGIGLGKFKTDIYYGIQKSIKNDQITVSIQTINGIIISGRAGLGVGLGAEFWQKGMFYPVFAHLWYDFTPKDNTPFAYINLGQAFGKRDSTYYYNSGTGGLMFNLGFGYKMKIGKRFQFEYEIFYRYQAIKSSYRNYYTAADSTTHFTTTDYTVPYNFAGFKIGVLFH
ncbi:MAG: hypothetical protein NTW10_01630 [Bacteroidetes bacterium]|nr:hypothetical protein [Bacteroidota bacterium]